MTTYHILWTPVYGPDVSPFELLIFGDGARHSLVQADDVDAARELHEERTELGGSTVGEYQLVEELTPAIAQEALDNGVTSVLVGIEGGEPIFDDSIVPAVAAQQ